MIARSDMLLLGVGGGGCRLACSVVKQSGVNFKALAVDTDASSSRLAGENAIDFLLIGRDRLLGQGTGGDVASARVAADDDMKKLEPYLGGVRLAVVVVSLGSGTGGGATPKILDFIAGRGITTLCFATLPFGFEGPSRAACASSVVPLLEESADTLVTMSLDDLHAGEGSDNLQLAMEGAIRTIGAGVSLMWRMVCMPGYIQLDSEKLRSLVVGGKVARFGFAGSSDLSERAASLLDRLSSCRLLCSTKGKPAPAEALLVGILGGDDLLLSEIRIIMNGIRSLFKKDIRVEMGTVQDALFSGRIEVVLFAFENRITPPPVTGRVGSVAEGMLDEPPVADFVVAAKPPRKSKVKSGSRLVHGPSGRGKFQNCEATFYNGVDLDVPAYMRYGLNIEK